MHMEVNNMAPAFKKRKECYLQVGKRRGGKAQICPPDPGFRYVWGVGGCREAAVKRSQVLLVTGVSKS